MGKNRVFHANCKVSVESQKSQLMRMGPRIRNLYFFLLILFVSFFVFFFKIVKHLFDILILSDFLTSCVLTFFSIFESRLNLNELFFCDFFNKSTIWKILNSKLVG